MRSIRLPGGGLIAESHLTKYKSLMPSLALIIHIVDCDHMGPVGKEAAVKAVAWCEHLESHAYRIYGAAANPATHSASLILNRKDRLPHPFRIKDIQQKGWAGLSETRTVKNAVRELAESGYVRRLKMETGGRPTEVYEWNLQV